jgi:UDP-N-acetylmuramate dehydrogenase
MAQVSEDVPLIGELNLIAGLTVKVAEPLARYTSMKIGGPADWYIEAANAAALAGLLQILQRHRTSFCLLGNGSNVLISDHGIRGAVIRLTGEFRRAEWQEIGADVRLIAGAAYAVSQVVREAARKGYTGLEFAEGIPGSVGGALYMNAGAYGSEFEKVVDEVEAMTSEGRPLRLSRQEMTFSYRDSNLPAGTVVTRVILRLQKAEAGHVGSRVHELVAKRKNSQPSGFPNSGSMFRNPPGDFAGRLIEGAGLKGKRIGQCQISPRHANFIVNLGGGKASEVRQLMALAWSEVRRQFGVELTAEVKFFGEWPVE